MTVRVLVACLVLAANAFAPRSASAAGKSVHVNGYTRKDGTYVAPYSRSSPRTSARGFTPSVPDFTSSTSPRDVPVAGYTTKDGTYVRPHMRHIDGIKDPEPSGFGGADSSSQGHGHRTEHRATARGVSVAAKSKKQYPSRKWRSGDGEVLVEGRMQWRGMNNVHIIGEDGSVVDLKVDDLGEDDRSWLDAVRRDPNGMKVDAGPDVDLSSE